jgi:hypothetical protein
MTIATLEKKLKPLEDGAMRQINKALRVYF